MDKAIGDKIQAVITEAKQVGWCEAAKWLYEQGWVKAGDALLDEAVRRQEQTAGQKRPDSRQ